MVITVINFSFQKTKPRDIVYRDYKAFDNENFEYDLKFSLTSNEVSTYSSFEKTFVDTLNIHAPLKKKVIRANQAPYVTKRMRKAIMRRTQLQNKYFKYKTPEILSNYKKQKNFCSKLYKKEKKQFYNNLKLNKVTDNKLFWKTIKPLMSDKGNLTNQICLVDNEKLLINEKDIATTLNNYFDTAVSNLEIIDDGFLLSDVRSLTDSIEIAVWKFETHPGILLIKHAQSMGSFGFVENSLAEITNEINMLNKKNP